MIWTEFDIVKLYNLYFYNRTFVHKFWISIALFDFSYNLNFAGEWVIPVEAGASVQYNPTDFKLITGKINESRCNLINYHYNDIDLKIAHRLSEDR